VKALEAIQGKVEAITLLHPPDGRAGMVSVKIRSLEAPQTLSVYLERAEGEKMRIGLRARVVVEIGE
jgi:hypothetical protein